MILFFLGSLLLMDFLQSWNNNSSLELSIDAHPSWRKKVTNEVINIIKIFVTSCFIGGVTKMVIRYREQMTKLKNSNSNQVMHRD